MYAGHVVGRDEVFFVVVDGAFVENARIGHWRWEARGAEQTELEGVGGVGVERPVEGALEAGQLVHDTREGEREDARLTIAALSDGQRAAELLRDAHGRAIQEVRQQSPHGRSLGAIRELAHAK